MGNTDIHTKEVDNSILEFITESLSSSNFKLISLAGDASSRRYYRVVHDSSSSVLMVWEPFKSVTDYPFLSVQEHFYKHHVHVPAVISMSPEKGLILLEDLGDLTLERKFWEHQNADNIIPFYKMALDELLKIHFTATNDADKSATCFNIQFDKAKFLWELNYTKKHLLEDFCKLDLSVDETKALEDDFDQISEYLDEQPKRISHRDFHSRNLMLNLDKMTVIDFQDARLGPVQYDLVSLFCDSYVGIDEAMQKKLIAYYLEKAQSEYGEFFNYDDFMKVYNVQLIQRCFKACGSFASFYNTRGDVRYLEYLHPTLTRIFKVLELEGFYPGLTHVFKKYSLLELDYEAGS